MPLISLVGLPGSGKSTIGRRLGTLLGLKTIDIDLEIEAQVGCSIAQYFERSGEESFRDVEQQLVEKATRDHDAVIATGGGAVLRHANRTSLKERSTVVYLDAPLADLSRRLRGDRRRPLLNATGTLDSQLQHLSDIRDPLYRQTAHLVVPMGGHNSASAAAAVNAALHALTGQLATHGMVIARPERL